MFGSMVVVVFQSDLYLKMYQNNIFYFLKIILTSAHQNNTHKIEHQPKNKHLFETIIPWKQIKSNNAVHFLTNSILNDKIKILKIIKRQKNIL